MKKTTIAISLVMIFATLSLLNFASASITEDLFSENVTNLAITINPRSSQIDFYFNSEGYEWDKFSIQEGSVQINNLYLSSLLSAIEFKIENNDNLQFTEISIEEGSTLQAVIDNYLTLEDYNFSVEEINQNVSLINQFIELDNSETYQTFEKSGNHFIYNLNSGHQDVNIDEAVNEAVKVFNISNVLSELGIENIYNLSFTAQVENLNAIPHANGNYNLNLNVADGNETYSKTIKLILTGFEEPVQQTIANNGGGGNSDNRKDNENKEETPKIFLIAKQTIENGYSQILEKYQSMEFTLAEKHSVQVLEIYSSQVKLKIQSKPIYAYMSEGEKRTFNISDEEILTIEVMELNEKNIELNIKGKQVLAPEEPVVLNSNEENQSFFRLTGNAIKNFTDSEYSFVAFLGVIFVALVFVAIGLIRKRK